MLSLQDVITYKQIENYEKVKDKSQIFINEKLI